MFSPVLMITAVFLVGAHLAFGRAELDMLPRLLFAVPGLLALIEIYRFYRDLQRGDLPFNVFALLQYYVAFAFPSLIETQFFDLNGPVVFTETTKLYGSVAVGGGGIALYAGMRLGEVLGVNLRPHLVNASPPAKLPVGFETSAWAYSGLCVFLTMVSISAPSLIPGTLRIVLDNMIAFDLAIGVGLAQPELFRGYWSQRLGLLSFASGAALGLLRGSIDPVMRLGMVFIARRWSSTRKIAWTFIGSLALVYVIFQPAKSDFRARVWGGQEQVGYTERVNTWAGAVDKFWSRDDGQQKAVDSAVDRMSELDPVFHAIQIVPATIQYLDGQGWSRILTAPIPRFLWPDKPTTEGTDQRYAVIFNRQTDEGARTTAILLPLLVDGYWNLGFMGVGIACFMMGLWAGICQRLWSGDHWALKAMGVAHLARLVVAGSMGMFYSGFFQQFTGLLLACWIIYGGAVVASNASNKKGARAGAPAPFVPRRAPLRRAPTR